jgi:hypothetical protein
MSISPEYYPPFKAGEIPEHPSQRMPKALDALYRASVEVHRTLYRLTLLHEITRNLAFVMRVCATPIIIAGGRQLRWPGMAESVAAP